MYLLAIETSCDDTGVALLDLKSGKLVADVLFSHTQAMSRFRGVVPEIAAREHMRILPIALREALEKSSLQLNDVARVVVTHRPGLLGSLLVGVSFAKGLAYSLGVPLSGLDHMEAHLFSPLLEESAPSFPWIALVVSGGHTDLYLVKNFLDYQRLGTTLDDAAGEAFDKIGKLLGFDYPAGPIIDRWVAQEGTPDLLKRFKFPVSLPNEFDFSFSGLKTAVSLQVAKLSGENEERLALAMCAQEAILKPLTRRIEHSTEQFGVSNIVVTGGVACNSRLRGLLPHAFFPKPRHCTDNAAMVASLGYQKLQRGCLQEDNLSLTAAPN